MGYTTDFTGEFTITPPLSADQVAYLKAFASSRRMKRNPDLAAKLPDPLREAVGLPIGEEGAYFVGAADENFGQGSTPDVLDSNSPPGEPQREIIIYNPESPHHGKPSPFVHPTTYTERQPWAQPGLWCQWVPSEDGAFLAWDFGEKFYEYDAWLRYLIEHFLKPWGRTLNGEVMWQGEDPSDRGLLRVKNNVLEVGVATISYSF